MDQGESEMNEIEDSYYSTEEEMEEDSYMDDSYIFTEEMIDQIQYECIELWDNSIQEEILIWWYDWIDIK